MQDAQQNKRLVKNKVLDDNMMSMIIEYMPFLFKFMSKLYVLSYRLYGIVWRATRCVR